MTVPTLLIRACHARSMPGRVRLDALLAAGRAIEGQELHAAARASAARADARAASRSMPPPPADANAPSASKAAHAPPPRSRDMAGGQSCVLLVFLEVMLGLQALSASKCTQEQNVCMPFNALAAPGTATCSTPTQLMEQAGNDHARASTSNRTSEPLLVRASSCPAGHGQ